MARMQVTKDFWISALRADGPAFRTAAAGAPLDAPVPSCPKWTVQTLVQHLGAVYEWVRGHVNRGVTEAPDQLRPRREGLPTGPASLEWWDGEFAQLMELLDTLDPEAPAWNWAPQAKRAGFWHRRMAHEVSVHRWDAESAAGRPTPIETKLAADGVNEVLDTWLPAGRRKEPTTLQGVVHLVATDLAYEWFLRLRGSGVALLDTGTILDSDDHHARAEAAGTASDLQLVLMGRRPIDVLSVRGDRRLVAALHAA